MAFIWTFSEKDPYVATPMWPSGLLVVRVISNFSIQAADQFSPQNPYLNDSVKRKIY